MKKKFSLFNPQYAARSWFVLFNSLFFIALMAIMIVPIFKIFADSMVNQTVYGLNLLPRGIDPETNEVVWFNTIAYKRIISDPALYHPFLISIYTTLMTTFLGLLISTLGAYVLIQRDMPGVKLFGYLLLFTMIFNGGLIPTFLVMKKVGLLDSLWAVIFPTSMNVYNLVLMRSFFEGIPTSLFEAAEIDGCTPMGIFIKIVLPLSKAALASIGLFFAVAAWSIVPFMFIYPFCQKYFMTGVTMGAVKE